MSEFSPEQFLKCPGCHRTNTVRFSIHLDGDTSFECVACGAYASGYPLNTTDRTYTK